MRIIYVFLFVILSSCATGKISETTDPSTRESKSERATKKDISELSDAELLEMIKKIPGVKIEKLDETKENNQ